MSNALRNRPMRWVASLYGVGSAMDWALAMALMVYVYDRTGSTLAAAAMLVCAQFVPAIAVLPIGGLADRWSLRPALAGAFLAHGIAVLVLAAFTPQIFVAAAVIGTLGAVVRTMLRSAMVHAAPGDGLRGASGLLNLVRGATSLAGPAAAGVLLAVVGPDVTLICVGSVLLIAGAAAALMPSIARRPVPGSAIADDVSGVADGLPSPHGLRLSAGALLAAAAVMIFAVSFDEPILLAFVQDDLAAGVGGYGVLLTAWGVGVLVGSALFTRLLDRSMIWVFLGATAVTGVAHLGLALSPSIGFAAAFAVVGGAANGVDWAALTTALMERAPHGREAVIASRLEAVATAGPALGFLAGGLLASEIAARSVLLAPAVASLAIFLALAAQLGSRRAARFPMPSFPSEATPRGA